MDHNNILGTVLAGGKSQRFGEDKSQVKLAGKLLIDHMLTEIIDEFKELLIVSNNKISFHNSEKISIIEDFKKGLGPLGGVLSAMKWIKENNYREGVLIRSNKINLHPLYFGIYNNLIYHHWAGSRKMITRRD